MLFFFSFFLAKKMLYFFDWRNDWPSDNVPSSIWDGWIFCGYPTFIDYESWFVILRDCSFDCLSKLNSISSPPFLSFFNATTENRVTVAATSRRTFFSKKKIFFFQGNAILNHTHTILDVDGPCVDSATTNEKKEPLESKQMFPDRNLRPNRVKRVLERFW